MKKILIILIGIGLLFCWQCEDESSTSSTARVIKDEDKSNKSENESGNDNNNESTKTVFSLTAPYIFGRMSKTNLNGIIAAEGDITGAKISFKDSEAETYETTVDESGIFNFDITNATGQLTIKKFGFAPVFKKLKAFEIPEWAGGSLDIIIKPADLITDFEEIKTEKTYTTEDRFTIIVQPDSLRYEDGTTVTGEVRIAVTCIDPSTDFMYAPPLDSRVNTEDGTELLVQLRSQGMLYIHIEDKDGQQINNINPDYPITLKYPVFEGIENFVTGLGYIPYWYFNGTTFRWENLTDKDGNLVGFEVEEIEGEKFLVSNRISRIY